MLRLSTGYLLDQTGEGISRPAPHSHPVTVHKMQTEALRAPCLHPQGEATKASLVGTAQTSVQQSSPTFGGGEILQSLTLKGIATQNLLGEVLTFNKVRL